MKYLIILLSFTILSCGSRKVDLHKRINDIETNLSVKIKELENERKSLSEYIYTENFRADSIIEESGKRKIYNPSTEKKEQKKESLEEKSKQTETDILQTEKDKSQEKDKKIDRKQFNLGPIIILLVIISVVAYIFRKFLKNASWLFK
ncbi:hypothetical protein [Myroides odoratus]|uniref:hypothetical protein n=1 Tax=Myroides odoratus TaxID=256 RepID=UPI0039B05CFF